MAVDTVSLPVTTLLLEQPSEVAGLGGIDGGGIGTIRNIIDAVNPQEPVTLAQTQALLAPKLTQAGGTTENNIIIYDGVGSAQDSGVAIAAITDFSTQVALQQKSAIDIVPVGTDTPINVTFGAATTDTYASLSLQGADAVGNVSLVTLLADSFWIITPVFTLGRIGSTAEALLEIQVYIDGVAVPDLLFPLALDANTTTQRLPFPPIIAFFPTNTTIQFRIARSSNGNNDGGLYEYVSTAGFTTSPSAKILIQKID